MVGWWVGQGKVEWDGVGWGVWGRVVCGGLGYGW